MDDPLAESINRSPYDMNRSQDPTIGVMLHMLLGLLVWALQFTLAYGGHTLACTLGGGPLAAAALVAGPTVAAALVVLAAVIWPDPLTRRLGLHAQLPGRRTYDRVARAIGALSLIAILWTGATILLVAPCLQGR